MTSAFMAFLHHMLAFTLTACLAYELVAYRQNITIDEARRIQRVDLTYGVSAGLILIVGLLRIFYFEKSAAFYAQSPFFWVKMVTFAVVGLLSIDPTMRYIRWNRHLKENQPPNMQDAEFRRTRLFLWLEVTGTVIILFSAALMARGIGV